MIAILVAKWTADAISSEGVYDLAQSILGHPFLDNDHALKLVQAYGTSPKHSASFSVSNGSDANPALVEVLIPPVRTMNEITVEVPRSNTVPRAILEQKLGQLHARGLMDAGLVLVQDGMLQGYLAGTCWWESRCYNIWLTSTSIQRQSWSSESENSGWPSAEMSKSGFSVTLSRTGATRNRTQPLEEGRPAPWTCLDSWTGRR